MGQYYPFVAEPDFGMNNNQFLTCILLEKNYHFGLSEYNDKKDAIEELHSGKLVASGGMKINITRRYLKAKSQALP